MASSSEPIVSGVFRTARALAEDGTVVVYPGQTADPATLIAYRKVWTRHEALSISAALGIDKNENVRPYLID